MEFQLWQIVLIALLVIVGAVKNFNRNHPETREGEVFITNTDHSDYNHIGWTTKRAGDVAYDIYGKPIGRGWPGSFPVFAQKSELEEAGIDPETVNEKRVKLTSI